MYDMGDVRAGLGVETHYEIQHFRAGRLIGETEGWNRVVTTGLNKLLDATFKTGLASPSWFIMLVGAGIADAAITNGSPNLTSASALFTAADAGRAIIVVGAGTGGADLVTTILTYSSAGAVVLSANAATTVTGAAALWDARAADTSASHSPWTESAAYSNATRVAFTPGSIAAGSVDNSGSPASFNMNVNNTRVMGAALIDNSTKSGSTGTLYGMAPFSSPGSRLAQSGDTINVTATLTAAPV